MTKLFGVDFKKVIGASTKGKLEVVWFTHYTRDDTHTDGSLTEGRDNRTGTEYECEGIISFYEDKMIDGSLIKQGDREVLIIAASIPVDGIEPMEGDEIDIDDEVFSILRVGKDPAGATYTCQVRR